MKKNVTIKCISNNPFDYYYVFVYQRNKLIYKCITNSIGYLNLKLKRCRIYTIIVLSNNYINSLKICKNIFVNKCYSQFFPIFLDNVKKKNTSSIKVKLTDEFYKALPIKGGELILWPNI